MFFGSRVQALELPHLLDCALLASSHDQIAHDAGTLAKVTFVQRLNTLGGQIAPGQFTLPAFNGIPNFQLAIPYQADYIFLEHK